MSGSSPNQSQGFMCPHPGCKRMFSKRYNQQAHMRLHDGTRPFNCALCGKTFMWKSSLKSHAKMHAKLSATDSCSGGSNNVNRVVMENGNGVSSGCDSKGSDSPRRSGTPPPVGVSKALLRRKKKRYSMSSPHTLKRNTESEGFGGTSQSQSQPYNGSSGEHYRRGASKVIKMSNAPRLAPLASLPVKKVHMQHNTRTLSPDCISRVDHDAAAVLTTFR